MVGMDAVVDDKLVTTRGDGGDALYWAGDGWRQTMTRRGARHRGHGLP